jgi:PBP1b-binding outer membrane lipoprotein LpoB
MIKRILAVVLLSIILSGCVGTLKVADVSQKGPKDSITRQSKIIKSKDLNTTQATKDTKLKK